MTQPDMLVPGTPIRATLAFDIEFEDILLPAGFVIFGYWYPNAQNPSGDVRFVTGYSTWIFRNNELICAPIIGAKSLSPEPPKSSFASERHVHLIAELEETTELQLDAFSATYSLAEQKHKELGDDNRVDALFNLALAGAYVGFGLSSSQYHNIAENIAKHFEKRTNFPRAVDILRPIAKVWYENLNSYLNAKIYTGGTDRAQFAGKYLSLLAEALMGCRQDDPDVKEEASQISEDLLSVSKVFRKRFIEKVGILTSAAELLNFIGERSQCEKTAREALYYIEQRLASRLDFPHFGEGLRVVQFIERIKRLGIESRYLSY